LASGLAPGDTLLLRLGNTPDFPLAFLGAIAVGIVPVPTAQALTSPEITRITQRLRPRAILAHPGVALPDRFDGPILTDLKALRDHPAAAYVQGDPNRLAYLVFTSGSSGSPKPVAHAHRAIWARRMMWQGWYGLSAEDRVLHAGAFNWTFTLGTGLLDPWSVGATALIPAEGLGPEALPLLLKRHDATIFAAAPGLFRKLTASGAPLDLPKLRHGLSAGEKMPEALRQKWQAATGTPVHEALGMSECSTFVSGAPNRPAPEGTLGFPQLGRTIAVLDETGTAVSKGETGILGISRHDPGLFLGYALHDGGFDLPLVGGWFLTGDLVSQNADGSLTYHGRRDDLLTTGGFRLSPLEIEELFQHAEGVSDCAALSVEVKADTEVLVLAYAGPAAPDTLEALAAENLARYKQPRAYLRLDALPRTANGKLDRRALAQTLAATLKDETP